MDAMLIIPVVFLVLIIVLVIWASIFMRAMKKDKQRLATLFKETEPAMKQESLYLDMAESYLTKGDKEKALEYYYHYLRKMPSDEKALYTVGNLLSTDDMEEATNYWTRSAALGYHPAIDKLKELNIETVHDSGNEE